MSFLAKPVNELVGVNPNAGQTDPPPRPGTGIPVIAMPPGTTHFPLHMKNRTVVTNLQTDCERSARKLLTSDIRTACFTLFKQVWNNMLKSCDTINETESLHTIQKH